MADEIPHDDPIYADAADSIGRQTPADTRKQIARLLRSEHGREKVRAFLRGRLPGLKKPAKKPR